MVLLADCGMVRLVEPLLGTRAEVSVEAPTRMDAELAETAVIDEVGRLEAIFTVYDRGSALSNMRVVGCTDVPELQTVVDLATRWFERTDGAFNPAIQPLIDHWDRAEASGIVPPAHVLAEVASGLGSELVVQHLNLNAIAKGWIAERALAMVSTVVPEASSSWLSIGGDMVHRGEGSVVVGIENPARPYDNVAPMASVVISNEALATSGAARRWWEIDRRRYPKTLDPRTGQPVEKVASASVVCGDAATADVLATLAVVVPSEQLQTLARAIDAEVFLVHHDGSVSYSSDRFKPV